MKISSIHLPEEVIELILSKCAVKSVFRFKSVSKSWHSIISDPRFLKTLQSKLLENLNDKFFVWERPRAAINGLYTPIKGALHLVSLEEDRKFRREPVLGFPSPEFIPVNSCNGLILLMANFHRYILWNPLIGKHIVVPPFNPVTHQAFTCWPRGRQYYLGRDNPHRFVVHMHDFYYDSTTDDYKIVIAYEQRYAVYSCKNGSWDVKDLPKDFNFDYYHRCFRSHGFFYLHWLDEIRYFDTRDGKEKTLTLPNDVKSLLGVRIREFSGRLCLYELSEDRRRIQLWMSEEDGRFENSWRKVISMEKEEGDLYDLNPLCLSNEGSVVLWCKVRGEENGGKRKYFLYNPREKSFREDDFDWLYRFDYFPYSETLYMPSSNL